MDNSRFSAIAHRHHKYCNPMSESKLERLLEMIELTPSHKAIDIGAGKSELLIRLIEKYGITAYGIDLSLEFIQEASVRAFGRISNKNLVLINDDAREYFKQPLPKFEVAICIGSLHALGGLAITIQELKLRVKESGYLVIGECFWECTPSPDYLNVLGMTKNDYLSHDGTIKACEEAGLTLLWTTVASQDDWDEYESLYALSVENYCLEHPGDPDVSDMLARIREWKKIYYSMGRGTLGFGLYLFRNGKT